MTRGGASDGNRFALVSAAAPLMRAESVRLGGYSSMLPCPKTVGSVSRSGTGFEGAVDVDVDGMCRAAVRGRSASELVELLHAPSSAIADARTATAVRCHRTTVTVRLVDHRHRSP
jgi:hypothetical protein